MLRPFVVGIEDVGVADVARKERTAFGRDLFGERERLPVELLQQMLLADQAHLLAVGVVRERLDDVGACMDELTVELGNEIRVLEDDLGHECAGLEIASALELEQVSLGADDMTALEALE